MRPILALFLMLLAGSASAQEKIPLHLRPSANQVVNTRTEGLMTMAVPGPGGQSMTVEARFSTSGTLDVGLPDAADRLRATFRPGPMTSEMVMGNQRMAMPGPPPGALPQAISFTYAPDGTVADVSVEGLEAPAAAAARALVSSAVGQTPTIALAVGESTTTTGQFTLPVGLPGMAGGAGALTTTYTLTRVSQETGARVAEVAVTVDGTLGAPGGNGSPAQGPMPVAMTVHGTGTMHLDLGRGLTTRQTQALDLALQLPASGDKPAQTMSGRITTTSEAGF